MSDNELEQDQFIPGDTAGYYVIGSFAIAVGHSDPNEGPPIPCVAASLIPLNHTTPITVIWPENVLAEWIKQFAEARGKMIRTFPKRKEY